MPLDEEPEESGQALVPRKTGARDYLLQLAPNGLPGGLLGFHRSEDSLSFQTSANVVKPSFNPFQLVSPHKPDHSSGMRTFPLLILIATACCAPLSRAADAFGIWKMNPTRSTFTGDTHTQPQALTVRIEPHAKGEVFTVDRIAADGHATTSSTILYFDGKPRDFQGPQCSGTQSSRRVDSRDDCVPEHWGPWK